MTIDQVGDDETVQCCDRLLIGQTGHTAPSRVARDGSQEQGLLSPNLPMEEGGARENWRKGRNARCNPAALHQTAGTRETGECCSNRGRWIFLHRP